MSLIKYNSVVNDFVPTSFGHVIDRFFNESVARTGGSTAYSFVPKVDVFEDEKAFEVQVAVPGMNKEDFKIDINEDRLTISGERKYSKETKENNFRSIETSYGTFSRTFTLPDNIDVNKIEAAYNNGILELTLPKDEKKIVKTSIRVK
jgi:HSP20 family protein